MAEWHLHTDFSFGPEAIYMHGEKQKRQVKEIFVLFAF